MPLPQSWSVLLVVVAFALPLARAADSTPPPPKRYLISDLGAVGDGMTVNTKAIQAAIDRCATEGGGVIVVPKGTFLSGALYFKQGVNLQIEKDAVLKSTTVMTDFPPIYTNWEGIERYWTSAFLNFVGMKNVDVSGEGVIDGSGTAFGGGRGVRGAGPAAPASTTPFVYATTPPTPDTLNILPAGTSLPGVNAAGVRLPGGGGGLAPPRTIVFQNCQNVRASGFHVLNEARWGVVFIYSTDVLAENLDIRNPQHNIPSSDAMDICSSKNVHVTGCYFECNDDCLSIKAGKDEDGLRVNRPTEDVLIEHTHFAFGHGGAAMGSETSGGIRRVTIRDCVMDSGNLAPIRFKSQPSRGGVVEDITYENIELHDTSQAFEFNMAWRMVGPLAPPAKVLPVVRNVKLINITGTCRSLGAITGLADSPIQGVTFSKVKLTAQRPLSIQYVQGLDTAGLTADGFDGPAVVQRDTTPAAGP
jgi:polygalacturonase